MSQAVVAFLLLALVGAGMVAAGVYLLAGLGWALVAVGVECFAGAAFLKLGISGRALNEAA